MIQFGTKRLKVEGKKTENEMNNKKLKLQKY